MKQLGDLKKLSEVASFQWGMFTSAQAERIGVSRHQLKRLADKGHIDRLAFGVYKLAGSTTSQFDDIKAVWLGLEPKKFGWERISEKESGIVVGGHTSTHLYNVGNLWPEPYFFVSSTRKQTRKQNVVFRKFCLAAEDITLVKGIPTTSPEITIAMLVADHHDKGHIEDIVSDFYHKRELNDLKLAQFLSPYAYSYGFKRNDGQSFVQHLKHKSVRAKFEDFSQVYSENASALTPDLTELIASTNKAKTEISRQEEN